MVKNIESKNNNIWLIVSVMVVVGLAAGVIGASITGNYIRVNPDFMGKNYVYTAAEAQRTFATNQGILNMLNNCEIISAESGFTNCIQTCKTKTCVLGFLKDSYDIPQYGNSLDKYTDSDIINCSLNSFVGSHTGSDWTYESLKCLCCSP